MHSLPQELALIVNSSNSDIINSHINLGILSANGTFNGDIVITNYNDLATMESLLNHITAVTGTLDLPIPDTLSYHCRHRCPLSSHSWYTLTLIVSRISTQQFTHAFSTPTHKQTHSLTHSLTHSFINTAIHLLTHYSLIYALILPLSRSLFPFARLCNSQAMYGSPLLRPRLLILGLYNLAVALKSAETWTSRTTHRL